uniref:Uncharacterized protein n=1 Tax=Caulobacter sp. (strain K31) TaxID=366602 RepID=B0T1P1_CAUSK
MLKLFQAIGDQLTLRSRLGGRYAEARVLAAELDLDLTEIALRHGSGGHAENDLDEGASQAEREEKFKRLTAGFNSPYPSEQIAAAVDLRKWMVRDYGLERLIWFVPQLRERYALAVGPKAHRLEPIPVAPEGASRAELEAEALSLLERLKLLYTLSSEREILTGRMRRWALGLLFVLFLALMITRLIPNLTPPGAIRDTINVIANFSLIAFVGAAGAMVSVLRRTESAMESASSEIDPVRQVSALSQGLTAVFIAAFVGMSVSFVLVAFFASGLVREGAIVGAGAATLFPQIVPCRYDCPLSLVNRGLMFPAGLDAAKMMVWAFIGGFSEQLVPDVLDRLTKAARTTKKPSEAA